MCLRILYIEASTFNPKKKILDDVMAKQRRNELELYKLFAKDEAFYKSFFNTMKLLTEKKELIDTRTI